HEKVTLDGSRACVLAVGVGAELQPLRLAIEGLTNRLLRPSRMHVRSCVLRRGFLEQAELRFPNWERFAPHFWSHPVSSLWLTSLTGRAELLIKSGTLDRALSVSLGELTSDDVRRLAAAPPLKRLRFLGLHQQKTEDVIHLLTSDALPPVRALELSEVSSPVTPKVSSAGFTFRAKSFSVLAPAIPALLAQAQLREVRRLRLVTSWRAGTRQAPARPPPPARP